MLGLVNLPSESVDFYAQPKNSHNNFTIFGQYGKRLTISYTDDGRRVIDGEVENKREPQEMWYDLLVNLLIKNVFDGNVKNIHKQHINDSTEISSISDDTSLMKSQITSHPTLSMLAAMANVNSMNAINSNKKTNIVDKMILLMKKQIWWTK